MHKYFNKHISEGFGNLWQYTYAQNNLVEYLKMSNCKTPVTIINEIIAPVIFKSKGEIFPLEYTATDVWYIRDFLEKTDKQNNIFIYVPRELMGREHKLFFNNLKTALANRGYELKELHRIKNSNNKDTFIITKVVKI